jgi:flagellar biosynthetic protein FlhB
MSEAEDRTQPASPQRRQMARERGVVARSPELTAAAGLIAAGLLLGAFGDDLARGLLGLLRAPLLAADPLAGMADPAAAVATLRSAARAVAVPLLALLGGAAAVMAAVHQVQVGGLWAPALLAPDPARLLGGAAGADVVAQAGRGAWASVKSAVLAGAAVLLLRARWAELAALASLDAAALATAGAGVLRSLLLTLGAVALALGAVDYLLCWNRVEALLRLTPDEYREDLRAADGDPGLRSRRRKIARRWREDDAAVLPGAALVLEGPGGLAVLVAGSPPPGRVEVRQVARGPGAKALLREASRVGVPARHLPAVAVALAALRANRGGPLAPDLAAQLAAAWPRETPSVP